MILILNGAESVAPLLQNNYGTLRGEYQESDNEKLRQDESIWNLTLKDWVWGMDLQSMMTVRHIIMS